jgi:hypothetical protein
MSSYAATDQEARSAFISAYPFELINGGLGNLLTLDTGTGTSSRQALVGEGRQVLITNKGSWPAHLAFGTSTIVATTAYIVIWTGIPYTLTIPRDATHVAGLADGPTTVQITRGYGN